MSAWSPGHYWLLIIAGDNVSPAKTPQIIVGNDGHCDPHLRSAKSEAELQTTALATPAIVSHQAGVTFRHQDRGSFQ